MPGLIKTIEPNSAAEQAGLLPGDLLHSINGHPLMDVIDAQFYGAEDALSFAAERTALPFTASTARTAWQPLGIGFDHPTFDIDIRRCNNLCPFCFVLQNAPRMRRTLYIKDDDYRYSFLYGHYVTLTNLAEHDWQRIAEQRLSPLYVSVHSTNLAVRRACLRNATAPDVLQQLRWLAEHGIQTHTQLVITPGLNDGADMERSIHDLAALYPSVQTATIVPVGLTTHHKYGKRPHDAAECAAIVDQLTGWQSEFQRTLGTRFVFGTDEWYLVGKKKLPLKRDYEGHKLQENGLGMVRDFQNEWTRVKNKELGSLRREAADERGELAGGGHSGKRVALVTGTLFAPVLKKAAAEFQRRTGAHTTVVPVVNRKLGATITVAGLLMGADVIAAIEADPALRESNLIVLPRIMFDHPDGVSLDDVSPRDIARALKCTVALADWMGDVVDAVTGVNKLMFDPTTDLTVPIMREGGWAVEKYL